MFERLYARAMRNGSRMLFFLTLLIWAVGGVGALRYVGRFGPDNDLHPQWLEIFSAVAATVSWSMWPLFGAIAVHRLDRWLAAVAPPAPEPD